MDSHSEAEKVCPQTTFIAKKQQTKNKQPNKTQKGNLDYRALFGAGGYVAYKNA
jgi:hypothetical protein